MAFGSYILILSTLLYALAAGAYAYEGMFNTAALYLCYAGANVFLIRLAEGLK